MQRPITDFGQDTEHDWFAVLSCGHTQHVRHRPPFFNRAWVTTEAGRMERLGTQLDCVRCDRFELPESAKPYKRTPVFTQATVPAALLRDHTTKPGVWARIEVTEGALRYVVDALDYDSELAPGRPGLVLPEVPHRIQPIGAVSFFLEMCRVKAESDSAPPNTR